MSKNSQRKKKTVKRFEFEFPTFLWQHADVEQHNDFVFKKMKIISAAAEIYITLRDLRAQSLVLFDGRQTLMLFEPQTRAPAASLP